jgi:ribosome-associated protein
LKQPDLKQKERTIPKKKKNPPTSAKLLKLVEQSLDDDKAESILVIDLSGKSSLTDYMVIASGNSKRQVGAMAQNLSEKIKASGIKGVALEGLGMSDWVLVDAGDVIVHLFRPEVREFYNLEKMWGVPLPGEIAEHEKTAETPGS